jgi:hypothetical protein
MGFVPLRGPSFAVGIRSSIASDPFGIVRFDQLLPFPRSFGPESGVSVRVAAMVVSRVSTVGSLHPRRALELRQSLRSASAGGRPVDADLHGVFDVKDRSEEPGRKVL